MVHEPFGLPVCQQVCAEPVQPLAGSLRHGDVYKRQVQIVYGIHAPEVRQAVERRLGRVVC